jgi:peroxiredoxin
MLQLRNGDLFPPLTINLVGGGTLTLPEHLRGSYGVVLFTRGAWCPYCNAQLAAFSRATDTLDELGVKIVALSVDDEATASTVVEKHRLRFPVGFGADADAIAAVTGAYVNDDPKHLQSTGFVLDPDGQTSLVVYSSGAIGRLVPDDVAGYVRYVKSHH